MNNTVLELKNVFIKQAKEIFKTKSTKIFFKGFFDDLKIDKDIKFVRYDTDESFLNNFMSESKVFIYLLLFSIFTIKV